MSRSKLTVHSGLILLLAGAVFLGLIAGFSTYSSNKAKQQSLNEIDRWLLYSAQTIPQLLTDDFAERATKADGISVEEDRENITRLTRMANTLNLTYLYTLFYQAGQVYITSSSASKEELENHEEVRYFTPYPEGLAYVQEAVQSGQPVFDIYTDRWGAFRHVYIPLKTATGENYLLCADQEINQIQSIWRKHVNHHIRSALIFSLLTGGLFLLTYYLVRKNTMRQLKILNRELQAEEQRLDLATEAGGIGVWDRDIVNDHLIWDDRMYALYGVHKADFAGAYETWKRCVHPDDLERAEAEVKAAEQGEKPFDTEFRIIRPNGEVRHIRAFGKVIYDKTGNPVRMIGTNQDITEQVKSGEQFHLLFESTPGCVAIYRPVENNSNFVFVDLNPAGLRNAKLSREEVVGRKVTDVFPGVKESGVLGALQQAAETGRPEKLPLKHYKDSRIELWVENQIFKLPSGLIAAVYEDTTEKHQAEEALRKSEEKLRGIIENSTNMFYSHTPDHVLTFVSPQIKDILGYEVKEAMTRWTELATDHPINEQGFKLTEEAIRTGKPQPAYELQLRHKDGHPVWVEVREAPAVENGKTIAIVGSLTDITARKAAEAESKNRMNELERFNKVAVGREIRMIELKQEINALCCELGRPEPYPLGAVNSGEEGRA